LGSRFVTIAVVPEHRPPHEAAILVRDLRYTYARSKTEAISGLSFHVEQGEIFGFLGPSGSGKSTTQKILIGLLQDYRGEARIQGKEIAQWRPDDYAGIGVSFETPNHFLKLSGLENLRYFGALYRNPTRHPSALLESLGLASDQHRRVEEYSKGMRARLSLARALLHQPSLLLLDEPTGGLDPVNAGRVKEIIRAERDGGTTVFLTTHDMVAADELCDRVAFIVDGRIASLAAPRALKLKFGSRTLRVEYSVADRTRHTDYPMDGLAENADFHRVLREQCVQTMHTREASLADVFARVTGRTLA
jgi:fluoroquinolone transport system ATP-binding protein